MEKRHTIASHPFRISGTLYKTYFTLFRNKESLTPHLLVVNPDWKGIAEKPIFPLEPGFSKKRMCREVLTRRLSPGRAERP